VARGITFASFVVFVRGGNIVDNTDDLLAIIRSLTTAMQAMVDAMQFQQNAVQLIEERVVVLENER
jgi:hypothetical protein